jgi:tetratricopeptide (TPR) repeat protein
MGKILASNNQADQAIIAFRTAVATSAATPENPLAGEAMWLLGRSLERQGYWKAALDAYTKLDEWTESNGRAYAASAMKELVLSPQILKTDRGKMLLLLGKPGDGALLLEKAYEQDHSYMPAAQLLVKALASMGKFDKADKLLKEIALTPSQRFQANELTYLLAFSHVKDGNPEQALRLMARMSVLNPELAPALPGYLMRLSPLMAQGLEKSFAKNIEGETGPDKYSLYFVAGVFARIRGDSALAVEQLQKSIAAKPEFAQAYPVLLDLLVQTRRQDKIDDLMKQATARFGGTYFDHFMQGKLLLSRSKFDKALEELAKANKANDEYVPALLLMAQAYAGMDQESKSGEALMAAMEIAPQNPQVCRALFDFSIGHKKLEDARAVAMKLLERDPQNFFGLQLVSEYYLMTARPEQAAAIIGMLLAQEPDDPEVWKLSVLGVLLDSRVKEIPAEQAKQFVAGLTDAIVGAPGDSGASQLLASVLDKAKFGPKDSAAIWAGLYERTGHNVDVGRFYAATLMDAQEYEVAANVLAQMEKLDSGDVRLRATLVEALEKSKQYSKAQGLLEAWIRDVPADQPEQLSFYRFKLLGLYSDAKEYDKAIKLIDEWLAKAGEKGPTTRPDDPKGTKLREMLLAEKIRMLSLADRFDQALKLAQDWLDKSPDSAGAQDAVLGVYTDAGKWEQVVRKVDELVKASAKNKRLLPVKSSALDELGRDKEALEALELAYKNDKDDSEVNNDLGYWYADHNMKLDQAESMVRHALADEPDSNAVADSLAWVFYKQGKFADALRTVSTVFEREKDANKAVEHDHAGDICYRLGHKDEAIGHWTKALEQAKEVKRSSRDIRRILGDTPAKIAAVKQNQQPKVAPIASQTGAATKPANK